LAQIRLRPTWLNFSQVRQRQIRKIFDWGYLCQIRPNFNRG